MIGPACEPGPIKQTKYQEQKSFASFLQAYTEFTWLNRQHRAIIKSFLLLFFKKEALFLASVVFAYLDSYQKRRLSFGLFCRNEPRNLCSLSFRFVSAVVE